MFYEKWLMIDYWLSAFRGMCYKLHKKSQKFRNNSVGFGSMCRVSPKERRAGGASSRKFIAKRD